MALPLGRFRKFIIIGNEGIGKSAFGLYCLWRALRSPDKRAVIYLSSKDIHAWIFQADGTVRPFDKDDVEDLDELDEPSTLLICDSLKPPSAKAFTILITSPERKRWSEFFQWADCTRLYFPVFSWEEIERMWETCFPEPPAGIEEKDRPKYSKEAALQRYNEWGGIPRYVLAKPEGSAQKELSDALKSMHPASVALYLARDEVFSDAHGSQKLLHLKNKGESGSSSLSPASAEWYDLDKIVMGSPHIRQRVTDIILEHRDLNVLEMLLAKRRLSSSGARFAGDVFERYAPRALARGGSFPVRELLPEGKGAQSELELQPAAEVRFTNLPDFDKQVQAHSGELDKVIFLPPQGFPAIDAVLPGLRFANCTINKRHGLLMRGSKSSGLAAIVDACGSSFDRRKGADFFWLMPMEDFASSDWRKPQELQFSGTPAQNAAARTLQVRQWVMGVPLTLCAVQPRMQQAATGAFQATKSTQQCLAIPRLHAWQPKLPAPNTTTNMLGVLRTAVRALKKY